MEEFLTGSSGPTGQQKPKALIVENNMILSLLYETYLEQLGFEVIDHLVYGRHAVDRAVMTCPDLILMDILLDGPMDGIEAARAISQNLDVPIIFITAHSDTERKERVARLRQAAFLEKPINFEQVRIEVEKLMGPIQN